MGKFGSKSKLSQMIVIEPSEEDEEKSELSADLRQLARTCLPDELKPEHELLNQKELSSINQLTCDLCFVIENDFKFTVHKSFICERCDYFKTFLHDPFNELTSLDESALTTLHLKDVSKEVFTEIVYFIYSNEFSTPNLEESILFDVMLVADIYLLPSLKRKCASELTRNHLNKENLFDLLRISRVYDLKKLEFACISFLAVHLFDFEKSEELRELIMEDASKLKMRQETDTIDIIDDLRYAINELQCQHQQQPYQQQISQNINNYKSSFDGLLEKENKLSLIDRLLRELNLEC